MIKTYALTLRVPLGGAFDDPSARQEAVALLNAMVLPKGSTVKLQEVFANKQPRSIILPAGIYEGLENG